MTEKEIIAEIETSLAEKFEKDRNYIRYSYYEVNIKYTKTKEDRNLFMQLLKTRLENDNYKIYYEGQSFNYKGASILVQINEELIAIKNEKEDVKDGIIQRGSSKKIRKNGNKSRN